MEADDEEQAAADESDDDEEAMEVEGKTDPSDVPMETDTNSGENGVVSKKAATPVAKVPALAPPPHGGVQRAAAEHRGAGDSDQRHPPDRD